MNKAVTLPKDELQSIEDMIALYMIGDECLGWQYLSELYMVFPQIDVPDFLAALQSLIKKKILICSSYKRDYNPMYDVHVDIKEDSDPIGRYKYLAEMLQ